MSNNSVIQICLMRTAFAFMVARCGLCFLMMLGLHASCLGQSIKAVREDDRRRDNLHLIDSIEQESIFEGWQADRGWIFRTAEERKVVRDDSILAFGGAGTTFRYPLLLLIDGSSISGFPKRCSLDEVVFESRLWGTLTVPLRMVRGIVAKSPGGARDWRKLERELVDTDDPEDAIFLTFGGWRSGVLRPVNDGGVLFDADQPDQLCNLVSKNGTLSIEASQINAFRFSPALTPMLPVEPNSWILHFQDGDRIVARLVVLDSSKRLNVELQLPITLGSVLEQDRLAKRLVGLERTLSEQATFLADKEPASFRHLPQFSVRSKLGRNQNLLGDPLMANQRVYASGLSMPSASQASYRISENDERFLAELCVPSQEVGESGIAASVIAKVLLSRGGKLDLVYTSEVLQADDKSIALNIEVKGAKLLVLLVEPAEHGDVRDELYWLNARLIAGSNQREPRPTKDAK